MSFIRLTPEVHMRSEILYLVRVDKEEVCFCETEKEAILVIDSLAAAVQKEMTNEFVKVYREDIRNGEKVILSTQSLGYFMNGIISPSKTFDYVPVSQAKYIKGRHEIIKSEFEISNFIPFPETFENLLPNINVVQENDPVVDTE
jgi:hypothetical protein